MKAVGTKDSGYLAKQLLAAMQTERLDEPGTDCHTTRTVDLKLTASNIKDFKYRYIVENGKLIELTQEELTKRIGTTVKLRSPLFCLDPVGSCNVCAGNMNYKLNNLNIGLGCSRVAETLKKLGMKKFHVSNLKSKQIDPDDMLI